MRVRVLIAVASALVLLGLVFAPNANASYYPGKPLGAIGSKAEDDKCAKDDLCTGEDKDHDGKYDYIQPKVKATTSTKAAPKKTVAPTKTVTPSKTTTGIKETAYLTGYSMEDNTPRNSRDISNPVIHKQAAGKGTFQDPITVAVGHSINPTKMRFAQGTKFYVPEVRAYFIVEDTCGDGDKPQNGGCWTGYPSGASYWIDLYVGSDPDDKCMDALTGIHTVIRNPGSGYAVVARKGDVGSTYYGLGSSCNIYSDTPVRG